MDSDLLALVECIAKAAEANRGHLPVPTVLAMCKARRLGKERTAQVRLWLECALDWRAFGGVYESPLRKALGTKRGRARFGWPVAVAPHRANAEARRAAEAALAGTPRDARARRAVIAQGAKRCTWYIDDRRGLLVGPQGSTKAPGMSEIDKEFVVIGWDQRHLRTLLRKRTS